VYKRRRTSDVYHGIAGHSYSLRVRARDGFGNVSAFSSDTAAVVAIVAAGATGRVPITAITGTENSAGQPSYTDIERAALAVEPAPSEEGCGQGNERQGGDGLLRSR